MMLVPRTPSAPVKADRSEPQGAPAVVNLTAVNGKHIICWVEPLRFSDPTRGARLNKE